MASITPAVPAPAVFHPRVSVRSRLAHMVGPLTVKPLLAYTPLSPPVLLTLRAMDTAAGLVPARKRLKKVLIKGGKWRAHFFEPKGKHPSKILVYFHGGAFVSCGLGTHRRIVEELSLATSVGALSVDYRQYPEGSFEDSVADATQAVEWLLAQGYRPADMVLVGDSAGGGLAMRVAGDFLGRGLKLGGVVTLSGWLDFDATPKLAHHWEKQDAYIPACRLEEVATRILGRPATPEDSPLHEIREGFPPLLLISGATEVLRIDTERAAARAQAAGVEAEVHYFRGGVHAFPVALDLFPEARQALSLISSFIQRLPGAGLASVPEVSGF